MQPIDAAWLAGLLEGEGCFNLRWGSSSLIKARLAPSGVYKYPSAQIIVQMTDLDVLERVLTVVGAGSIRPVKEMRVNHKPLWRFAVGKRADVLRVMEAVRPFMGARRTAKIDEIVAVLAASERRLK